MKKKIILASLLITSLSVNAKVKLQPLFSDNMVLQQQTQAPIWGEAKPNGKVTVKTSWDNRAYNTRADAQGKWKVAVETPKAGGPYSITISDGKPLVLNNVLIGEVWLCGGQSNMEMPVQGWNIKMNEQVIAHSSQYTNIRLLQLNRENSLKERSTISAKGNAWRTCSPETVRDFSATGFFFGKNIQESQHVPVGLIMTCWGGTVAEDWISAGSISKMKCFDKQMEEVNQLAKTPEEVYEKRIQNQMDAWKDKIAANERRHFIKGKHPFLVNGTDLSSYKTMQVPVYIEKAGLPDYDGIVWFTKVIDIPEAWKGKELQLSLGTIDDNDITYFNHAKVGETNGFTIPRSYKIPAKLVKGGKAIITVRIDDDHGNGGFYDGSKRMFLKEPASGEQIVLSGEWFYDATTPYKGDIAKPQAKEKDPNMPTVLYNAMIKPLVPFAIRGVIWYQGASNATRAYQYRELLPLLIQDWRNQWGTQFPFYIVQLANFRKRNPEPSESDWAELREAQYMTARNVENCGMMVNIDLGMADDPHTITKDEVGRRLALVARANTYGEKVEWAGPTLESYKTHKNEVVLHFSHAKGLHAKGSNELTGFAVAGLDHKFHWAKARIEGDNVIVSAPEVDFPVAVRYAWADNPACNLYNSDNLPAAPFRTDDWPGITYNKQ